MGILNEQESFILEEVKKKLDFSHWTVRVL